MKNLTPWLLSVVLLGAFTAPPLPATSLFQERNEQEALIRRAERLQRQMQKMKARYQKEGKKEYVTLLEEGLRWISESQLIRKMNETSLAISSKERRSIQAAKNVLKDIDKLLSILLDRRSIEDLEKETKGVEKQIQTLKRLQKKQEQLKKAMKKIMDASRTREEARITQDLKDLAQQEREEARKNTARAGSLQNFLEKAMDELKRLERENEEISKQLDPNQPKGNEALGSKAANLFRKTQKEIAKLEFARSLEKAVKDLSEPRSSSSKALPSSLRTAQRRMEDLRENYADALPPEMKKSWDSLLSAMKQGGKLSPETQKKLRNLLKDFDQMAREDRKALAKETEDLGTKTQLPRAKKSLGKAAKHLRKSSQDVSKKEALLQTGKALQELMDAIAASSPPPIKERALEFQRQAKRLASGLQAQQDQAPQLGEELGKAVTSLKKTEEEASRLTKKSPDSSASRNAAKEISKALKQAKASLQRSLDRLKERVAGKAREAARDQANLNQRLDRIAKQIKRAQEEGKLSPSQAQVAEKSLNKARGEMKKAEANLNNSSPGKAALNQSKAAESLEKAARDLAKNRKLGEKGKAEMNRLAKKQEELEEEILRLAERIDPRKNAGARQALEEAAKAAKRAKRAMNSGRMDKSQEEQQKAAKKLEEARKNLENERDRYWRLRQEELLFRIGEEVGVLIRKQKELSRKTLDLAGEAGNAERLPRRLRTRIRALGRAERELETRARFLAENLKKEQTLVFTFVLESIADDLAEIGRIFMARRPSVDSFVQGLQAEVLARLRMLKASLEEEQKNKKKKKNQKPMQDKPNSNQGDQKPKLVPDVAELRMLKRLELSTKQRIDTFLQLQESLPGGLGELETDSLKRLALRHAKVSDLFRTFLKTRGLLDSPDGAHGKKGKNTKEGVEKKEKKK